MFAVTLLWWSRLLIYQDPQKVDFGLFQLEFEIFQARSRFVIQNLSERALLPQHLLSQRVDEEVSYFLSTTQPVIVGRLRGVPF